MLQKITAVVVTFVPAFAMAAGPDLTALTDQVDFGTVSTAILGVAASVAGLYILWRGVKFIYAAIKG